MSISIPPLIMEEIKIVYLQIGGNDVVPGIDYDLWKRNYIL